MHNCPLCSLSINRDLNASINILSRDYTLFMKSINVIGFSCGCSNTRRNDFVTCTESSVKAA